MEHDRHHVELDVGRGQPVARAHKAAVLADVGGQRPLALHPLGEVRVVERVLERDLVLAEEVHARGRMVGQVHADLGRLGDERDLQQLELIGPPDPREGQELRRVVGAAAHDHFALGAPLEQLARALGDHAGRARAVEGHPVHLRVGLDRQVRPVLDRVQVGDRCARPAPVALGDLVPAEAVLLAVVEVVVGGQAHRVGGLEERLAHHAARPRVADRQRPAGAMELAGAALVVLGALEVGQQVVPAPARAAGVAPLVVVERVAADVDHRVERRRSAEHAPAREVDAAVGGSRLPACHVVPVVLGAEERAERRRDVDEVRRVGRPGLDQEHAHVGVLAQAVGQHAACRAGADDHVVVHRALLRGCAEELLRERGLPFLVAIGYVVLHHGLGGVLAPESVYSHGAAVAHPWRWALIHLAPGRDHRRAASSRIWMT